MDMEKRKFDRQSRAPEFVILCLAVVVVASIGGLSYLSARSARAAAAEQQHTQSVIDLDRSLISALKDAETGQRGYLVTGQAQYLEPYNRVLPVIPDLLSRLNQLTQATPDQHQRVQASSRQNSPSSKRPSISAAPIAPMKLWLSSTGIRAKP